MGQSLPSKILEAAASYSDVGVRLQKLNQRIDRAFADDGVGIEQVNVVR